MEKIKDYKIYTTRMKKSLLDKIYFVDKIEANIIVDYGCADGTLIHFLATLFPELQFIGFDIDEKMISEARVKCEGMKNCSFTSRWEDIETYCGHKAIILSSIIHEVYSYGSEKDISIFWDRVYGGTFKYIAIRDMIPSISMDKRSDINDIKNIMRKARPAYVRAFEQVWGSIEQNKNLIHYLLKYRYTENWDREVRENYMPITREQLIISIPDEYEIMFHEHFVLPYLKDTVFEDFGIVIKDNTHLKMVLKKID